MATITVAEAKKQGYGRSILDRKSENDANDAMRNLVSDQCEAVVVRNQDAEDLRISGGKPYSVFIRAKR